MHLKLRHCRAVRPTVSEKRISLELNVVGRSGQSNSMLNPHPESRKQERTPEVKNNGDS